MYDEKSLSLTIRPANGYKSYDESVINGFIVCLSLHHHASPVYKLLHCWARASSLYKKG